jgi:DNA-binding PadR family transcriptional regulator
MAMRLPVPLKNEAQGRSICMKVWEVQGPGPARRVYSLTEPGQAEFAKRVEAWESYSAAINALLSPRRASYG